MAENKDRNAGTAASEPRSRLQPIRRSGVAPWQKAANISSCHLYWMPVAGTPIPFRQRQWCLRFAASLRETIQQHTGAEANLFLQMKVIQPDLADPFLRHSTRFVPLMGLSRRRNAPLPPVPDEDYIKRMQKDQGSYDHKGIQPDYVYWFLYPETEEQEMLYFGNGGLMTIFASLPDASSMPPVGPPASVRRHPQFAELLANDRVEKMQLGMARMTAPFFKQSKSIFGRGLETELQYPGLKFIVPLLTTGAFFEAGAAEIEEWFTVFDAVLTESPEDKGLLLATKRELDFDEPLQKILEKMDEEKWIYPEFA